MTTLETADFSNSGSHLIIWCMFQISWHQTITSLEGPGCHSWTRHSTLQEANAVY